MRQQLTLGLQDILPTAQPLNVGVADVGNNPQVGLNDPGQVVDLTKVVHSHLQHGDLVAGAES